MPRNAVNLPVPLPRGNLTVEACVTACGNAGQFFKLLICISFQLISKIQATPLLGLSMLTSVVRAEFDHLIIHSTVQQTAGMSLSRTVNPSLARIVRSFQNSKMTEALSWSAKGILTNFVVGQILSLFTHSQARDCFRSSPLIRRLTIFAETAIVLGIPRSKVCISSC